MTNNESIRSKNDRKALLSQDLKEGLEGLKEIFVAGIVLLQDAAQALPRKTSSESLTSLEVSSAQDTPDRSLSVIDEEEQNSSYSQPLDVSIEEIEDKESNIKAERLIRSFLYPILAALSTTALITGVLKIDPLIQWARTQNECIENTSSIDGVNPADLTSKVMHCNGGHAY